jgi:hypothetical protein
MAWMAIPFSSCADSTVLLKSIQAPGGLILLRSYRVPLSARRKGSTRAQHFGAAVQEYLPLGKTEGFGRYGSPASPGYSRCGRLDETVRGQWRTTSPNLPKLATISIEGWGWGIGATLSSRSRVVGLVGGRGRAVSRTPACPPRAMAMGCRTVTSRLVLRADGVTRYGKRCVKMRRGQGG